MSFSTFFNFCPVLSKRNSFSFPYAGGELVLFPGVNLAVPEAAVKAMKEHPVCKVLIEQDVIEFLTRTPDPSVDIEGIPVVDRSEEPIPVMPVSDRSAAKAKPKDK
jgi:hypothetical protein